MDLSVFGKAGSIPEAMQQIAAQKQAMQTAKLDQLSKQNIYATQVLAGATATGDQNAYDAARQHLANNGVDVSTWAPDVKTAGQQVTAARQAQYTQNPLLPLLNAGLKQESNDLQRANLTGQLPQQGLNIGGMPINNAMGNVAPQAPAQWKNPDIQEPVNTQATAVPIAPLPINNIVRQNAAPTSFSPPAQMPGETLPAYRARVDQAFAQYKESPQAVRAKETAQKQGAQDVKTSGEANAAEESFGKLDENLKAMENMIKTGNVPESNWGVPASVQAAYSRNIGKNLGSYGDKGTTAENYTGFSTLNAPTALNVIGELMKGGQIRGNQYIEKMIGQGFMVDPNLTAGEKLIKIKEIRGELKNAATAARNIAQKEIGGETAPYTAIETPGNQVRTATESADPYQKARDAIKAGAPRLQVEKRLLESGLDPRKL